MSEQIPRWVEQIEYMRKTHGWIGGVYIFLGHDGNNECWLTNIEGEKIISNCYGGPAGIQEAVDRTFTEWVLGVGRKKE